MIQLFLLLMFCVIRLCPESPVLNYSVASGVMVEHTL